MTPRRLSRLLLALLALIGLTFLSSQAFSQDESDLDKQIEAIEANAKEAYDRGDYLEAIRLLNKCNSLRPHPNYLINIAFTYSEMGDCTNAKTFVQSATDDPKLDADAKTAAQNIVKNCVEKPSDNNNGGGGNIPKEDSILPWIGYPLLAVGLVGVSVLSIQDILLLSDKEKFVADNKAGKLTEAQFNAQKKALDDREYETPLEIGLFVGTSLMAAAGLVIVIMDLTQNAEASPDVEGDKDAPAEGTLRLSPLLAPDSAGFMFEATF